MHYEIMKRDTMKRKIYKFKLRKKEKNPRLIM